MISRVKSSYLDGTVYFGKDSMGEVVRGYEICRGADLGEFD